MMLRNPFWVSAMPVDDEHTSKSGTLRGIVRGIAQNLAERGLKTLLTITKTITPRQRSEEVGKRRSDGFRCR